MLPWLAEPDGVFPAVPIQWFAGCQGFVPGSAKQIRQLAVVLMQALQRQWLCDFRQGIFLQVQVLIRSLQDRESPSKWVWGWKRFAFFQL